MISSKDIRFDSNHEAETLGYMLNPHCCVESLDNCLKHRPKEHE